MESLALQLVWKREQYVSDKSKRQNTEQAKPEQLQSGKIAQLAPAVCFLAPCAPRVIALFSRQSFKQVSAKHFRRAIAPHARQLIRHPVGMQRSKSQKVVHQNRMTTNDFRGHSLYGLPTLDVADNHSRSYPFAQYNALST